MGVARCEAVSHPSPSSACVVGPILRSVTGPRTTWRAHVGEDNAHWLATECRTARLAGEYRPRDLGGGYVEVNVLALGALRELGEEEDGFITDDGDGLRIWLGDDAYELERTDQSGADHHP
jgi:hypothetical protein